MDWAGGAKRKGLILQLITRALLSSHVMSYFVPDSALRCISPLFLL